MSWKENARCYTHPPIDGPELFFGKEDETLEERQIRESIAKKFCDLCPVQADCLAEGLQYVKRANLPPNLPEGIWGGLTLKERRRLLRKMEKQIAALEARLKLLSPDDENPNVA